eukprot:4276657-Pyramimonas_sp.AAC.1
MLAHDLPVERPARALRFALAEALYQHGRLGHTCQRQTRGAATFPNVALRASVGSRTADASRERLGTHVA